MSGDLSTWARAQWDRLLAGGLVVAGAVAVVFGYFGVARARYVPDGLAFVVSGGIGGLFLLGLGATLFVSADLHDEWRKLDRIDETLERLEAGLVAAGFAVPVATDGEHPAVGGAPGGEDRVPVPALNRFGLLHFAGPAPGGRGGPAMATLGFVVAAVALVGGWLLAGTAHGVGRAAGGAALAAAGLLCGGAAALLTTGARRRGCSRRAAAVASRLRRLEGAAGGARQ
jgi:hypothetical protein